MRSLALIRFSFPPLFSQIATSPSLCARKEMESMEGRRHGDTSSTSCRQEDLRRWHASVLRDLAITRCQSLSEKQVCLATMKEGRRSCWNAGITLLSPMCCRSHKEGVRHDATARRSSSGAVEHARKTASLSPLVVGQAKVGSFHSPFYLTPAVHVSLFPPFAVTHA